MGIFSGKKEYQCVVCKNPTRNENKICKKCIKIITLNVGLLIDKSEPEGTIEQRAFSRVLFDRHGGELTSC